MSSGRRAALRAALQAGALVALADGWALRHAWGSAGELMAVAVGVAALLLGAALALSPWLQALTGRGRAWSAGAALVAAAPMARALASTPTARALAGAAAPLWIAAALALVLAALSLASRAPVGRIACATMGLTAVVAQLILPRRLYPSLRMTLLTVGFTALACARLRARGPALSAPLPSADSASPPPPSATAASPSPASLVSPAARSALATLGTAALLLLCGRALSGVTANARFVVRAQAPAAGLVLDAIDALRPASPGRARAASRATAAPAAVALPSSGPGEAALGDAHLVLVTVDALRADRLRPDLMPTLSGLAARGLDFRRAYATAPSTAASITSLLTAHPPWRLDGRPRTLAERLRAAGWFTQAFYPAGLFFDGGGALQPYADARFGFAWADTRTLDAATLTDAALARVRTLPAAGEPRAFLWIHYFDPHEPYALHDLPAGASAPARYDAEVRAVDDALAHLVAGLATLARPTLLVVTADHGEEFGEHGGAYHGSSLYDEQLRVPLVVAAIGRPLAPASIDTPVSLVDVAPTVTALLGSARFTGEGRNLTNDGAARDLLAAVDSRRLLLRGNWKLIRDLRRDVDELYQLASDPGEQRNLATVHADVATTLRRALDQWLNQSSTAALSAILLDGGAPAGERSVAARELGARAAYAAADALRAALADADSAVRAEAALALAELTDRSGQPLLRAIVDDARFGDRAAVMLGRLRDPAAASRLHSICRRPPAAGDTGAAALRREAAHYLGFVGDATDVAALLAAAADPRVRGSAYVALGRIAGRTHAAAAASALRDRFAVEDRADARAELAWALGLAGDEAAVPQLAAAAAADPPLPNASESLIRLGALDGRRVGGLDFTCRARADSGSDAPLDRWLAATSCTLDDARALFRARDAAGANVVVVRARALGANAQLTLLLDGMALPTIALGPRFREVRLPRRPSMVEPIRGMVKPIRLELRRAGAPVELDHVLFLRDVTPARL